jgi:UDP-glucuronate decarboxylase
MTPDPLGALRAGGLRVAVTGATGWLGRVACEVLAAEVGADRIAPFASRARDLALDAGATLDVRPLEELPDTPFDVLLHYAYVTREHAEAHGLDAYVAANTAITARVRAAIEAQRPRAVLHASSGAAATAGDDVRADPYGVLKRRDEGTLREAARAAGARCVTVRVFNLAGPWLTKPGFAIADLVLQVARGERPVIRAPHPVRRSYVDVEDLARLSLAACVADGLEDDLLLETAGEEVVELGELAGRVAAALGRPDLAAPDRNLDPGSRVDHYVGDGTRLHALARDLGVPLRGLDEQILRTADHVTTATTPA